MLSAHLWMEDPVTAGSCHSGGVIPVDLHAPAECRADLTTHLTACGLTPVGARVSPDVPAVGVWLGPPSPCGTDAWVRASQPHLVVSLTATHVRIGPFVDPGLTACLYCLQASSAATVPGAARVPPPGLLAVAAGWIAHDVRRWHEGREPASWSATALLDTSLELTRQRWLRHPHCGCGWGLTA